MDVHCRGRRLHRIQIEEPQRQQLNTGTYLRREQK